MANRVIIVDAHRAKERIPYFELKQMMGRVSRSGDSDSGKVDFVVGMNYYDEIYDEITSNKKYLIKSCIANSIEELSFHLMPEISSGKIQNINHMESWCKRSLCSFQGNKINWNDVIEELINIDAISKTNSIIIPTKICHLSSKYYFCPFKINQWMNNLSELFLINNDPDTFGICWALSSVGPPQYKFDSYQLLDVIEEYECGASSFGDCSNYIRTGICWWNLLGGPSVKFLKPESLQLKKDWKRIFKVLQGLNYYKKWDNDSFFEDLNVRISNRIQKELTELCKLGFNKSQASELYNEWSISNLEELRLRMKDVLSSDDEKLCEAIGKIIYDKDDNE